MPAMLMLALKQARIIMYVVIVEFTIREEFAQRFRDRVRQQARDALEGEAECHVFDVCVDPRRADFVLLYEVYTDRAAFDAHLASAHFIDFDETVRDWISDKQVADFDRLTSAE
jgi:autoinducer 2-degrading protein